MTLKTGPLSRDEIQAVWEGAVDKGYSDPLIAGGEGKGFEAWTQLFAQLERASQAIDTTTQAMFIAPWSGQTNDPASGGQKATVTLTISRTQRLERPLFLAAGLFVVVEETTDSAPVQGITVQTGRRYLLTQDLYFPPGDMGPHDIQAEAALEGYGFNNPRIGTISAIEQVGTNFNNILATVTKAAQVANLAGSRTKAMIVTLNEPDMFVPAHVGQYMFFTAGANAGLVGRMTSFISPNPPLQGSGMELELGSSVVLSPHTGAFIPGEYVQFTGGSTSYGVVRDFRSVNGSFKLGFTLYNGPGSNVALTSTVLGLTSGATGTISALDWITDYTAEAPVGGSGGASWRVLDWVADWGLTATNKAMPENGKSALLDELGSERAIYRTPGESDTLYRQRVQQIADVVTPNAIRRAINRALPGLNTCFREVGQVGLPGFFFDGDAEAVSATPHGIVNDAYDFDTLQVTGTDGGGWETQEGVVIEDSMGRLVLEGWFAKIAAGVMTIIRRANPSPTNLTGLRVRGLHSGSLLTTLTAIADSPQEPSHRWHRWLDYTEFRAFFIVQVPGLASGEFGFPYDVGTTSAYDVSVAYDGFPRLARDAYLRVWNAVEAARAGGVLWEMELGDGGTCP
jgi:hypothetical protein